VNQQNSYLSKSLRAAMALSLALSLGACSRSQQITSPGSSADRDGSGHQVLAGCPSLIANTPATASAFLAESAIAPFYLPGKLRVETMGDLATGQVGAMGPCIAADAPAINVLGGHANLMVSGTAQSITTTGQRLTFGALVSPGTFIEPGVVLATDADGNVLEMIWPSLALMGSGVPVVRVQLAAWNEALVNPATKLDMAFDITFEQNGVVQTIQGSSTGIALNGTVAVQNALPVVPCPTTLGAGGTITNITANIVQYRSKRMRFEATGDVAGGVIDAAGRCAAADVPSIQFVGGSSNMLQAGTNISVTPQGRALTFGPLLFPGVLLEPGIVIANDANKNVLEIVWPGLAGLGAGAPILRTQFNGNNPWIKTGRAVDMRLRFDAIGPDGQPASFNVVANNVVIPVQK
jgi:hypothetical protein